MNKRQLKKITTLYKDGLSCEICISILLDLTKKEPSINRAIAINDFYESIYILTKKDNKNE